MTAKKNAVKTAKKVTALDFLNLANQPAQFEIVKNVPSLGDVGILKMDLGQRAAMTKKWVELEKMPGNPISYSAVVLQATVADESGEPLLLNVPLEKINKFPSDVTDPLLEVAFKINGMLASKVDDAEKN